MYMPSTFALKKTRAPSQNVGKVPTLLLQAGNTRTVDFMYMHHTYVHSGPTCTAPTPYPSRLPPPPLLFPGLPWGHTRVQVRQSACSSFHPAGIQVHLPLGRALPRLWEPEGQHSSPGWLQIHSCIRLLLLCHLHPSGAHWGPGCGAQRHSIWHHRWRAAVCQHNYSCSSLYSTGRPCMHAQTRNDHC